MLSFSVSGSFERTERALRRTVTSEVFHSLHRYGEMGRQALANATPTESGTTAAAWTYRVTQTKTGWQVSWHNTNRPDGVPLAIMLQYGYGTGTGGYVQGTDYINPAIKPIFDQIADSVWKEVTRI